MYISTNKTKSHDRCSCTGMQLSVLLNFQQIPWYVFSLCELALCQTTPKHEFGHSVCPGAISSGQFGYVHCFESLVICMWAILCQLPSQLQDVLQYRHIFCYPALIFIQPFHSLLLSQGLKEQYSALLISVEAWILSKHRVGFEFCTGFLAWLKY